MRTAVILAAGRGKRMGALTEDTPKPMIAVRGKPLLEHILERLREAGVQRALIVTGYKAEMIEEYFAEYPIEIAFRRQEVLNGTAGAAMLAREWVGAEPLLLTYGDILTEVSDYCGMVARLDAETDAVVVAKWVDDPWQGAAVYEEGGRVIRIVEKPPVGTSTTHWNSAGSYVFRPVLFEELERVPMSERGEYELTSALTQMIERGLRLLLYPLEGAWRDVGRPTDLDAAEKMV